MNSTTPPVRRCLPGRRRSWTQKARIGSQVVYLTCGEHDDGSLGEIFMDASKAGSMLRAVLDALAISISAGLQYGVPLQTYTAALRGMEFEPNGIVAGSGVTEATSILDWVAQELDAAYGGTTNREGATQ